MTTDRPALTLRRAIILVVVLGLVLPALLINGYTAFERYTHGIRAQTEELLQQTADILSNGMREPLWNINQESGNAFLEAMISRNEDIVAIEVRDDALGVFVASDRPDRRIGFTASTTKPVVYRGNPIGTVKVEVASARLLSVMIESSIRSLIAVLAQMILSVALILWLLERRLVRPLQKLGAGAQRLASRELGVPFTWQRLDEIGILSQRMEDTRVSLARLFEELDHKNQELEQDIVKRTKIEKELHEREARFRTLVEQSPIAIVEWDKHFEVIEWNTAAEHIFGFTRQQAVGRHASFLTPNNSRDAVDSVLRRITTNDGGNRMTARNRRADGVVITCQWSHNRIQDESGRSDRLLSIAEDITDKRRAEEALSLSEAKFAGAFQCNPDPVSIVRMSDWQIIEVNQAFERVTGYTQMEAIGKTALELDLWVDSSHRDALVEELADRDIARVTEWEMRTRGGAIRKCTINATLFSAGGERYIFAVMRDITEQRLLEKQKAEADGTLRRLAQGTRDIAGESFFDLLVADLASALRTDCAFIGLRVDSAPGTIRTIAAHSFGKTTESFDYALAHSPCRDTLEGDLNVLKANLMLSFPDACWGSHQQWQSYAGAPLRDSAGNSIGVLAVLHSHPLGNPDLVKSLLQVFSERASAELERKRSEEELRGSEQRFSSFFQSSPIAMFVTRFNANFVIKDINRAFERLFLCRRDEAIGRTTLELDLYLDPADRDGLIADVIHGGHADGREAWMRRSDGSKVLVQFSGHTFTSGGEKFGILACADITETRRIENEIRELNANLEQRVIERTEELQHTNKELATALETLNMAHEELVRSEKLAALGALVAGIAHELNTPVGNSMMVASTLVDQTRALSRDYRDHGLKKSDLERYLEDADKAGDILLRNLERAANLVTGFKQVAVDQTSSQRRKFSVSEVVSEVMLTLWPTLKKTAFKVRQRIPEELVMDSYPGPLGQVITNLVNNALLHGFDGRMSGTVTISVTPAAEGWIEMTVSDDGVGIAPGNLNRIFDPFFTTKLGAGGSGLGLNIVHNIVTGVLGGRMRVQSDERAGSTFCLTLPLVASHLAASQEAPSGRLRRFGEIVGSDTGST
jgi:PAS domain S-box-containing protein